MDTFYWHMNAKQWGANLHPGANLFPGAFVLPGANCAHEHGFRRECITSKQFLFGFCLWTFMRVPHGSRKGPRMLGKAPAGCFQA